MKTKREGWYGVGVNAENDWDENIGAGDDGKKGEGNDSAAANRVGAEEAAPLAWAAAAKTSKAAGAEAAAEGAWAVSGDATT